MTTDFKLLTVARAGRVATVTIDNPPVNVITMALLAELEALSVMLKRDPDLTVVVMRSADPDFFLAHFDVAAILERPTAGTAQRDAQIKPFHSLCERFRTMNKVVIGQIEGRIGGGEFVALLPRRHRRARRLVGARARGRRPSGPRSDQHTVGQHRGAESWACGLMNPFA